MDQSSRLMDLVKERHRLEEILEQINDDIDEELTRGRPLPSLHRLVFESLVAGEKGVGAIVKDVLESGYQPTKDRDIGITVTNVLNQLKAVNVVTKDEERRTYRANKVPAGEVLQRINDRFRASDHQPPRRGRPRK